jgi:hypothetical protein
VIELVVARVIVTGFSPQTSLVVSKDVFMVRVVGIYIVVVNVKDLIPVTEETLELIAGFTLIELYVADHVVSVRVRVLVVNAAVLVVVVIVS